MRNERNDDSDNHASEKPTKYLHIPVIQHHLIPVMQHYRSTTVLCTILDKNNVYFRQHVGDYQRIIQKSLCGSYANVFDRVYDTLAETIA